MDGSNQEIVESACAAQEGKQVDPAKQSRDSRKAIQLFAGQKGIVAGTNRSNQEIVESAAPRTDTYTARKRSNQEIVESSIPLPPSFSASIAKQSRDSRKPPRGGRRHEGGAEGSNQEIVERTSISHQGQPSLR